MRRRPLSGILLAGLAFGAPAGHAMAEAPAASAPETTRQQEVRTKGAEVMPFSLDRTMHYFDKTADGGVQRVRTRADAPEQITMIRSHLHEITDSFGSRDFDKPAYIHGSDMPGLAQLRSAKPGELSVEYRELADGAEIDYQGHTPAIVAAIHRWFDAQLSDHGRDATDGH